MLQTTMDTPAEERLSLRQDCSTLRWVDNLHWLVVWCHRFFRWLSYALAARALHYLFIVHCQYKIFTKERRLVVSRKLDSLTGKSDSIYSYACLASNCSSLFDARLDPIRSERNLNKLAVFAVCHPYVSLLQEPIAHDTPIGTPYHCTIILLTIAIELLVFRPLARTEPEKSLLVFMVAPVLARKMLLERAKIQLIQVRHSYANFVSAQQMKLAKRICGGGHSEPPPSKRLARTRPFGLFERNCDDTTNSNDNSIIYRFGLNDQSANDCLPLIRTDWWHKKVSSIMTVCSSLLLLVLVGGSVGSAYHHRSMKIQFETKMDELALDVAKEDCAIWYQNDSERSRVDLMRFRVSLNAFSLFVLCVHILGWTAVWGQVKVLQFLVALWELRCWIYELHYKLLIVRQIIKTSQSDNVCKQSCDAGGGCLKPDAAQVARFDYEQVRGRILGLMKAHFFLISHKPFAKFSNELLHEHHTKMGPANGGIQTRQEGDTTTRLGRGRAADRALAELLEKFYVELRLMNELKNDAEQANAYFMVYLFVCSYVFSFGSFVVAKVIGDMRWELKLFVFAGISWPILLISNAAFSNDQVSKHRRKEARKEGQ
jgi:hypothetical protein